MTDARLANPEPENWLMTRGNYKGWSYSALNQRLQRQELRAGLQCLDRGGTPGHELPPIVNRQWNECSSRRRTVK